MKYIEKYVVKNFLTFVLVYDFKKEIYGMNLFGVYLQTETRYPLNTVFFDSEQEAIDFINSEKVKDLPKTLTICKEFVSKDFLEYSETKKKEFFRDKTKTLLFKIVLDTYKRIF